MKILCDRCKREYESDDFFKSTEDYISKAGSILCPDCVKDANLEAEEDEDDDDQT